MFEKNCDDMIRLYFEGVSVGFLARMEKPKQLFLPDISNEILSLQLFRPCHILIAFWRHSYSSQTKGASDLTLAYLGNLR